MIPSSKLPALEAEVCGKPTLAVVALELRSAPALPCLDNSPGVAELAEVQLRPFHRCDS